MTKKPSRSWKRPALKLVGVAVAIGGLVVLFEPQPGTESETSSTRSTSGAPVQEPRLEARRTTAREFERGMLENGMDVEVDLVGPEQKTLRIEWGQASQAAVSTLVNDQSTMSNLRLVGFERLVITNGYGDSWSWNL